MAKVIVTSWMYPEISENPRTIERISSTVEDCKNFVEQAEMPSFGDVIEFARSSLVFTEKKEPFASHLKEDDEILRFYKGDGWEYLKTCLESDSLGQCVARIYSSHRAERCKKFNRELKHHWLLFQVRNLH